MRGFVCASALLLAAPAMADGTQTVFVNGTILTVDPQNSVAEAMAIADGTILAVGTEADVRAAASPEATVIDPQGRTLMPGLAEFRRRADARTLTVRATLAQVFGPEDLKSPETIVETITGYSETWCVANTANGAGVAVHTAKIFLDGVIHAPAQTGALLEPYRVNHGDTDHPDWQPGEHDGELYVTKDDLAAAITALAGAGLDVHIHLIRAMTINAARSLRMEGQVGSLEPGKFADFIVVDRDPTQIAASEISEIQVLQTWLGGTRVF